MVALGCFSAQLVDAETKRSFREHVGPHGQYYVETEPDAEYFIQIQVLCGETADKEYNVMYFIDGQDLGVYTQISENDGPHLVGLCSRENGVTIKKAIRCVSPTKATASTAVATAAIQSTTNNSSLSPPIAMMGMVTVKFSQAICTGKVKKRQRNYNASQSLASKNSPPNHTTTVGAQKKKMLRSAEGSATLTSNERGRKKFKPGLLLQEINLHYCTALGLIYAGVLEKPPLWDMHTNNKSNNTRVKREENGDSVVPHHSCKRVKVDAVFDDGGIMLAAPKEYNVIEFLDDHDDDEVIGIGIGIGAGAASTSTLKQEEEEEIPAPVTSAAQASTSSVTVARKIKVEEE